MVGTTLDRPTQRPAPRPQQPRWDRVAVVRLDRVGLSARLHLRAVVVTVLLLAAAFAVLCWSLTVGDFPIPLGDVLATLFGSGNEDSAFVVRTLRLPRALSALLVGAGFGLSGAILQRLVRNPLASPDVIGISTGAAAAAVFVIVVWNGTVLQITFGALAGAALASTAAYLLAYRRGVTGYRFVLVGIGLTYLFAAITQYLVTQARIFEAQRAAVWLSGSLNGRGWDHVRYMTVALAVLVPAAVALTRGLRLLELGDEAARGLGARVERSRAALVVVSVALAGAGVAAAGPVWFVPLVAPQIARRLVGARSLGLLPAAACGALLLAASDLAARRLFAPTELPVGVVTGILGAPYLLYLIARSNKMGTGG